MFDSIKTYVPSEVFLTFGGEVVTGWQAISVKRDAPEFSVIKGIRGKNTRVFNPNTYAEVSITTDALSLTNDIFLYILSQDTANKTARIELALLDSNGSEVFTSQEAYVRGTAARTYESSLGKRDWVVDCLSSDFYSQRLPTNNLNLISQVIGSII